MTRDQDERTPQALQGVTVACSGCGRLFVPVRSTQRHCRPSCRVLALRRRRELDLFTGVADAIEPAVVESC